MSWILSHAWPLSYLSIALIDDIVYRKFHNNLFLSLLAVSVCYAIYFSPLSLMDSGFGLLVGGLIFLPLVALKVVGAGDLKFMVVFGAIIGPTPILSITVYALLWGTVIGLIKSILSGQLGLLFKNLSQIKEKTKPKVSTRIPFTAAIFLGWLTFQFHGRWI